MGQEVRRVPPHWEHPLQEYCQHRYSNPKFHTCYQPMYDQHFIDACKEWNQYYNEWMIKYPSGFDDDGETFWEWHGDPPDRKFYHTFADVDATWYQAYSTVSEGTPLSPPFETQDELIDYLVKNGDFWYQMDIAENGRSTWRTKASLQQVTRFVKDDMSICTLSVENGVVKVGLEQL